MPRANRHYIPGYVWHITLKHLSVDAESPISKLLEEAITDLLKKYEKKAKK